jgi:hypothetical protein
MSQISPFDEQFQKELLKEQADNKPIEDVVVAPVLEPAPVAPVVVATDAPVVAAPPIEQKSESEPLPEAKSFTDVFKSLNPEEKKQSPEESQFYEKFKGVHSEDLEIAQIAKSNPFVQEFIAQLKINPNLNPTEFFAVNTTDYSKMDTVSLFMESLKRDGVELSAEEYKSAEDDYRERLDNMKPYEQALEKKRLLAQFPKPEDPMAKWSSYVKDTQKQLQEQAQIAEMDMRNITSLATSIVGTNFAGYDIDDKAIRSILIDIQNDWQEGYCVRNGQYDYKLELENRVYAYAVRHGFDKIREKIKKEAEIDFAKQRQNVSLNGTHIPIPQEQPLTPERLAQRNEIVMMYGAYPDVRDKKLKEAGFIN